MKRSLLSGGIGIAVLAVTIPAGAAIQNQVSRPHVEPVADVVVVDLPTTTVEGPREPTTTRTEPSVRRRPPSRCDRRPPSGAPSPRPPDRSSQSR